MKATLRKMGNRQGVLIPKAIVSQLAIKGELDMTVKNGAIVLSKPHKPVRAGWVEACKRVAAAGDDVLAWSELANAGDQELVW